MTPYQVGYVLGTIIAIAAIIGGVVATFLLIRKLIKAVTDSASWRTAILIIVAFICVWVRIGNGEWLGDSEYVNNPSEEYVMTILKSVKGVGAVQAVSSNTDKNKLLNEKKGGTAAIFFELEEVNQEDFKDGQTVIDKGTDAGGCVEVFKNTQKMRERARHLSIFPLTAGRYKTVGTVIVRMSAKLSRDEQSALAAEICERLLNDNTSDNIEVSYNHFAIQKAATVFIFLLIAIGTVFYFVKVHKESTDDKIVLSKPEPSSDNLCLFSNTYSDELFPTAVDIILETGQASAFILQRRLKLGYSRASHLLHEMEGGGYIGSFEGTVPRRVFINREQWEKMRNALHYEPLAPPVDTAQIIHDEENWRRARMGLSPIEYELQKVDGMEGHAFEEWCADLLKHNGFHSVEVTPGSGDQGVDVIAEKDGLKYAVQCKRYSSDLGNTPVQEVVAGKAFYHCHIGAVMTNRYFTSGAKQLAQVNGILLWDRDVITDMLKSENPS